MSISRVCNPCEEKKPEKPFPKLMRGKINKSIWLMISPCQGTCLVRGNNLTLATGTHFTYLDHSKLEDYNETLCLKND